MNVKLSFAPVSRSSFDLLAVVLDDSQTLHAIDDAVVAAHVQRAAAGFRDKDLKREYYAMKAHHLNSQSRDQRRTF